MANRALMVQLARQENAESAQDKRTNGRNLRGQLTFMDRMEQDSNQKQYLKATAELRADPQFKKISEKQKKAMMQARAGTPDAGPQVAVHHAKKTYEGNDRKIPWAPLECY